MGPHLVKTRHLAFWKTGILTLHEVELATVFRYTGLYTAGLADWVPRHGWTRARAFSTCVGLGASDGAGCSVTELSAPVSDDAEEVTVPLGPVVVVGLGRGDTGSFLTQYPYPSSRIQAPSSSSSNDSDGFHSINVSMSTTMES